MSESKTPHVILTTEDSLFHVASVHLSGHGIAVYSATGMYPLGCIRVQIVPLIGAAYRVFINGEEKHARTFTEAMDYTVQRCKEIVGRPPKAESPTVELHKSGVEEMPTVIEPKIVVRARDDIKEEIREALAAADLKITEIATDKVHGSPYLLVYVRPDAGKTRSVKLYGCDGRVIRWATPTTVVTSSGEGASFIIGHYRSLELICNAISTNEPEVEEMDEETPKKFTIAAVSRDSRAVDLLRGELPDGVLVKSVHRQEDRAEQDWDVYIDIVHFGNTEVSAFLDRKYEDELIEDEYLTAAASCPRLLAQKLAEKIKEYLPEDLLWKHDFEAEKLSDQESDNLWYVVGPKVGSKLCSKISTMAGRNSKWSWANRIAVTGENITNRLVSFTKDNRTVHVLVHFKGKVDYKMFSGENSINDAVSWFSDKYLNRV